MITRIYETIAGTVQVKAVISRGEDTPITVGPYALTRDESRALRATLERAERDVRRGPGTQVSARDERCDWCGEDIQAGTELLADGESIQHAGPCPGEERGHG